MTKADVLKHPEGSAERVIAHAEWRASRGKRPSMTYHEECRGGILIANPREALEIAYMARDIKRMDEAWGMVDWDARQHEEEDFQLSRWLDEMDKRMEVQMRLHGDPWFCE